MSDPDTEADTHESLDATSLLIPSTYKTRGKIGDPGATGVFGYSTAGSGDGKGVVGQVDSPYTNAVAIYGEAANSDSGASGDGVVGVTQGTGTASSPTSAGSVAYGVRGQAANSNGVNCYGVYGGNNGTGGGTAGVLGWSFADDGQVYGVRGETNSDAAGAAGVWGDTNDGLGETYGVKGTTGSASTGAAGVYGSAATGSGNIYGVKGETDSEGVGAAGVRADTSTGATGVRTDSASGKGLHVTGVNTSPGRGDLPGQYMSLIKDKSASGSSVLALKTVDTSPDGADRFLSFFKGDDTLLGAVEANQNGDGVKYESSGSDYAECMPRLDPDEEIDPAEIVGVVDGAITKRTENAEQAMVVSDRAVVTGNVPGPSQADRADFETVAFVGQVPAKVRGEVEYGDLVVPSGESDGTGEAVDPERWSPGDAPVVGRAMEATDDEEVTRVSVAVGIDDPAMVGPAIAADRERIEAIEGENERLRSELRSKDERIADLEAEVASLREQLDSVEDRVSALTENASSPRPADD